LTIYKGIIAVCYEIRTKYTNTLCGQNAECFDVEPGGTQNNYWALES